MIKFVYGDGKVRTQQGTIEGEGKCLSIDHMEKALPVGATAKQWNSQNPQELHEVLLVFKTLESARTLQDEINELCATWSRELSEKVDDPLYQDADKQPGEKETK